jgi:hypothetical protein
MAAPKSEQTKKLEAAKVDEGFKGAVKSGAVAVSRGIDTVQDMYNRAKKAVMPGQKPEEFKRGGKVMPKKSTMAPKKGYACGGKVMKKTAGRGR